MTARNAHKAAFLAGAGWAGATVQFLAGDASDRSYDRVSQGAQTAVLMDAPPGKGDDPALFVTIAAHLRIIGLSPPRILASDLDAGFLLLEDLGDNIIARLIPEQPALETPLYTAATDVLVHLQSCPALPGLPDLSAQEWATAAAFSPDWYSFAITGARAETEAFIQTLTDALLTHADGPRCMILRDYHAENLLWLPDRSGIHRVGLLDFQLGQMGQPGYDLVSLLQDARRDVPLALENAMIERFARATGADSARFSASYATLGAQRSLRIMGIFARLCLVAGKPRYVAMMPRVWAQLQRNLAHPALASLADICERLIPEPTPARMERIITQCGQHPTP